MSSIGLYSDQYGIVPLMILLQPRGEFERMCRHHPIVMIGRRHHRGWVVRSGSQGMVRRVYMEVLEHVLVLIGGSIIKSPACTCGEFMISQHIQYAYRRESHLKELWALGHGCAHQ